MQLDSGNARKKRTQPQKHPDYVMEGDTLYRNIPHRAGSENVAMCKMPIYLSN